VTKGHSDNECIYAFSQQQVVDLCSMEMMGPKAAAAPL
jgi:hypothetical protein